MLETALSPCIYEMFWPLRQMERDPLQDGATPVQSKFQHAYKSWYSFNNASVATRLAVLIPPGIPLVFVHCPCICSHLGYW